MSNFLSRFLSSRFSGYLAIAGVVAILGLVWYIYNEGKKTCENQVVVKTVEKQVKSKKNADAVTKKVQALDEPALDRELCRLGIVREASGCK